MNPVIEKGIPPPAKQGRGTKTNLLREMQVGDSILYADMLEGSKMRALAHEHGRRVGQKFASRVYKDGMRIWRIA